MVRIWRHSGAGACWLFVALCVVAGFPANAASGGGPNNLRLRQSGSVSDRDPRRAVRACFVLEMTSAGGDGWNGARFTISSFDDGVVVAEGTLSDGVADKVKACVDDLSASYAIEVTSGLRDGGVGWSLGGGALVGSAPEIRHFSVGEHGDVVERGLANPLVAGNNDRIRATDFSMSYLADLFHSFSYEYEPLPASDPCVFVQTVSCADRLCDASTIFTLPTADYVISTASLTIAFGGNLGSRAAEVIVKVDGDVIATCGGFDEDCVDPLMICIPNFDVTQVARTGTVTVAFDALSDFGPACTYAETDVAVIMEATLVLNGPLMPTSLPTLSPVPTGSIVGSYAPTIVPSYALASSGPQQSFCLQMAASTPFKSIAGDSGVIRLSQVSSSDDTTQLVQMPFEFPWFSSMLTSVIVSSNGQINMDGSFDDNCCSADTIAPGSNYFGGRIAIAQEDLNPSQDGDILFLDKGASVVISFERVPFYS